MGGRGASSGISTNSITISNGIKREMLSKGLSSKFKGVQRDAKAGTGSFTYKDARAIGSADALKMDILRVHENSNNTLVEGIIRGKHVFYANKNSDSTIQKIKNNIDKKKQKQIRDSQERPEIRTTSTYDRWKKNHDKNFDAWFNGGRK